LAARIRSLGGRPVCVATFDVEALDHDASFSPDEYRFCLFTSVHAVIFAPALVAGLRDGPCKPTIVAVGRATSGELALQGLTAAIDPGVQAGSEALLALPLLATGQVQGAGVLVVTGRGGRRLIARELTARGARLTLREVYRRVLPKRPIADQLRAVQGPVDVVVAGSGEALRNLFGRCEPDQRRALQAADVVTPSARVAALCGELGVTGTVGIAPEISNDGFARAVRELAHARQVVAANGPLQ